MHAIRHAPGTPGPAVRLVPRPVPLRPKVDVSEPGDALERSADQSAERVMRMADAPADSGAMRASTPNGAGSVPAVARDAMADRGSVLDAETRRFFEPRFGHDFSRVRVHADAAAERSAQALGAEAYTVGNDIVFGAGRHAPRSSTGRQLLAHELAHVVQQSTGAPAPAIQRKRLPPFEYGVFETATFNPQGSGVEIKLLFTPDKDKCDATKIAMVQSVKAVNQAGDAYAINPTIATRMVRSGAGAGYAIDASGKTNNPLYFDTPTLGPQDDLKDTPAPVQPNLGVNTNHDFGFSKKVQPTDADRTTHPAAIYDHPEGMNKKGAGMTFETAALAIDGPDKGTWYGSVKWGYTMGGTDAAPVISGQDIDKASGGTPTANLKAAGALWNAGKTQGTLVAKNAASDGPPTVFNLRPGTQTANARLPNGTKLQQLDTKKGAGSGMIEAKILDGARVGETIDIFVPDVKDLGDGGANKPLPGM